jgi:hypothetical protein
MTKSNDNAKVIVPTCKSVFLPNLCIIKMATYAPIIISKFRKHGTIERKFAAA